MPGEQRRKRRKRRQEVGGRRRQELRGNCVQTSAAVKRRAKGTGKGRWDGCAQRQRRAGQVQAVQELRKVGQERGREGGGCKCFQRMFGQVW